MQDMRKLLVATIFIVVILGFLYLAALEHGWFLR